MHARFSRLVRYLGLLGLVFLACGLPTLTAATTGSVGAGAPIDVRDRTLELNYIICVDGLFPTEESPVGRTNGAVLGEVRLFAGNFAPAGWLPCDGRLLPVQQYEALYFVLGYTYGGSGNFFALPDMRGRVAVGTGPFSPLGQVTGAVQRTLTPAQMPAHDHALGGARTGSAGGAEPLDIRQPGLALHHLLVGSQAGAFEIGEIVLFAGTAPPLGNAFRCEGQILPIQFYTFLFAKIGTVYGGDGRANFAVPDLRGRSVIGSGFTDEGDFLALGELNRTTSVTLNSSHLPPHAHESSLGLTGPTGSGASFSVRQSSLGFNFLISVGGNYPPFPGATSPADDPYMADVRILAAELFENVGPGLAPMNGASLAISSNSVLFSLIGNRYGGNGVTHFNLPDPAGRLVAGAANPSEPGARYGQSNRVLTVAQLPSHQHTLPALPPLATTGAATVSGAATVLLAGQVQTRGVAASLVFEYGPTLALGTSVGASPATAGVEATVATSAALTGLAPGTTYHFRLRANSDLGAAFGATASFTTWTRLQAWRFAAFGSLENGGVGADLAAPRGDGVPNLLKFATGLNPALPAARMPGELRRVGATLEFEYPRAEIALAEVGFAVEWSDSLAPGSWSTAGVTEQVLTSAAGVQTVRASLPAGPGPRLFVRLRVTGL
jgi:microcystin-dependent protein